MENLSTTSSEVLRPGRSIQEKTWGSSHGFPRSRCGAGSHSEAALSRSSPLTDERFETSHERLKIGIVVKLSDGAGAVKHFCIQLSAPIDIAVSFPHVHWAFVSDALHASKTPVASIATIVSAIPHTSSGDSNRNSTTCDPAGISTARSNPNAVAISTFSPSMYAVHAG